MNEQPRQFILDNLDEIEEETIRLLNEAMESIVDAMNHCKLNERAALIKLRFSITTYLAASVAWILHTKAVSSGQLDFASGERELTSLQNRVMKINDELEINPPLHVRRLLDRSRNIFYQTVLNNLSTDHYIEN